MKPKTLLDTDILSALMRKKQKVRSRAKDYLLEHPILSISLITQYEILRGLKAKRAIKQIATFDEFCFNNEVMMLSFLGLEEPYASLLKRTHRQAGAVYRTKTGTGGIPDMD